MFAFCVDTTYRLDDHLVVPNLFPRDRVRELAIYCQRTKDRTPNAELTT